MYESYFRRQVIGFIENELDSIRHAKNDIIKREVV